MSSLPQGEEGSAHYLRSGQRAKRTGTRDGSISLSGLQSLLLTAGAAVGVTLNY